LEEEIMAQSLSRILVQIIFSTKDRFPYLTDKELRKRMHAYIARVFYEHESPAIEVGGTEDHVHILCLLSRNYSVGEIVRKAKANSTSWAKAQGGRCIQFSWQAGYGAFSIDPSRIDPVQNYIQCQEEHHRKHTFQEEYLHILRQCQMEYDERYLWT
jgi:putative transposase